MFIRLKTEWPESLIPAIQKTIFLVKRMVKYIGLPALKLNEKSKPIQQTVSKIKILRCSPLSCKVAKIVEFEVSYFLNKLETNKMMT